jgi:hypothetical protein
MIGLDSIAFDRVDCVLIEESERRRVWENSAGVVHTLTLAEASPSWAATLPDTDACAQAWRADAVSARGEIIGFNAIDVHGRQGVVALARHPGPQMRHPLTYLGRLAVPIPQGCVEMSITSKETGTTGVRESTVTGLQLSHPGQWPLSIEDEFYDRMFPSHPLTLVRARLRDIIRTLTISGAPSNERP